MSARKAAVKLWISERAIRDLSDLEEFSIAEWGEQVAAKYIGDVEAALVRLQQRPDLFRSEVEFHPHLYFYRVNKHLLVCDLQPKVIFLLTVIHSARDIPSRLAELAPTLAAEAELLHHQLRQGRHG